MNINLTLIGQSITFAIFVWLYEIYLAANSGCAG